MDVLTETQRHRDTEGVLVGASLSQALYSATRRLAGVSGDDARLEAQVLLAHALGVDRARLLAMLNDRLDAAGAAAFEALVARRLAREPLAYIVGRREFYGIEIECSLAALIPRPETEMLVEFALDVMRSRSGATRVADVGTGTGALAVAIAMNAPDARNTATDVSDEALALARRNVDRQGVGKRIDLRKADLLEGLGTFDVIVANLPYVTEADWDALAPEIREHEPRSALVAGPMGLEIIERLLRTAPAHLAPVGALAVEIGASHGDAAVSIARSCVPGAPVSLRKDLAGLDRMLVVRASDER